MDHDEMHRALGASSPEEWERLGRYLEGRATPREVQEVERWLAADPARRELVEHIRRARIAARAAPELWDAGQAWARVSERLEGEGAEGGLRLVPRQATRAVPATGRRRWWPGTRYVARLAATIAILAGGGIVWQHREALIGRGGAPVREVASRVGERVHLTLNDGTEVVLGPSSRLWFPERFGKVREVRLEGQAVFDVAPDARRTFLVRTERVVTRVLGTRFGVWAYPEDEYVDVAVAEGVVAVAASGAGGRPSETRLTAGQAVRVDSAGVPASPRQVDARRLLAWTEGRITFDRVPLREVVRTLERTHGARVELSDSVVAGLRLTGEFRESAQIADIVRVIALSLEIEYRETDSGFILFRPRGGGRQAP